MSLSTTDLKNIGLIVRGTIEETVPDMMVKAIKDNVPDMIIKAIEDTVPGMITKAIEDTVPSMITKAIEDAVPGMINKAIDDKVPNMISDNIESKVPYMINDALEKFFLKLLDIFPTKQYLEDNFVNKAEFNELKKTIIIIQDQYIEIKNFLQGENEFRYHKLEEVSDQVQSHEIRIIKLENKNN